MTKPFKAPISKSMIVKEFVRELKGHAYAQNYWPVNDCPQCHVRNVDNIRVQMQMTTLNDIVSR